MASRVAFYDLQRRTTETVLVHPGIVESPNWLPDNSGLLVNHGGLLWRIPFDDPKLVNVDTGFARRLNNDHGISPDGAQIAISDATEEDASCIYTIPISGGLPRRVTRNVPSYWHCWSPDGEWLTYTARRNGTFDIHVVPAAGGEEVRLTKGFDHTDGPDYSRDGNWIWFNGERAGKVDLWRMRPDGADLQKMTSGETVDWFPHPNPTSDVVLFIAYPAQTAGHPRDLPVSLRLLDPATGQIEVLYEMTGGQGSINTPCWAPDGNAFAFVETVDEAD